MATQTESGLIAILELVQLGYKIEFGKGEWNLDTFNVELTKDSRYLERTIPFVYAEDPVSVSDFLERLNATAVELREDTKKANG